MYFNQLGQPIGEPVPDWIPVSLPPRHVMEGRFCRVEPIDVDRHASGLFAAFAKDDDNRIWTYLPYGPFQSEADLGKWMRKTCLSSDPLFHAIVDKRTKQPLGVASYLRIAPAFGVIEVGHINYSPLLRNTTAATEAMFLMMRRTFSELGYRRYEWKCDALNEASKKAAIRLGFQFEGIFRQATMYKGRNRDTAWYSVIDKEWPALEQAYLAWLSPNNFDSNGHQQLKLVEMIERFRKPSRA